MMWNSDCKSKPPLCAIANQCTYCSKGYEAWPDTRRITGVTTSLCTEYPCVHPLPCHTPSALSAHQHQKGQTIYELSCNTTRHEARASPGSDNGVKNHIGQLMT